MSGRSGGQSPSLRSRRAPPRSGPGVGRLLQTPRRRREGHRRGARACGRALPRARFYSGIASALRSRSRGCRGRESELLRRSRAGKRRTRRRSRLEHARSRRIGRGSQWRKGDGHSPPARACRERRSPRLADRRAGRGRRVRPAVPRPAASRNRASGRMHERVPRRVDRQRTRAGERDRSAPRPRPSRRARTRLPPRRVRAPLTPFRGGPRHERSLHDRREHRDGRHPLAAPRRRAPALGVEGAIAFAPGASPRSQCGAKGKGELLVESVPAARVGGMHGLARGLCKPGWDRSKCGFRPRTSPGTPRRPCARAGSLLPEIATSSDGRAVATRVFSRCRSTARWCMPTRPPTRTISASLPWLPGRPTPSAFRARPSPGARSAPSVTQGSPRPLSFWMQAFAGAGGGGALSAELALLKLGRRLIGEGYEATTLDGVTELGDGARSPGGAGDDAVVAVQMLREAPWVLPRHAEAVRRGLWRRIPRSSRSRRAPSSRSRARRARAADRRRRPRGAPSSSAIHAPRRLRDDGAGPRSVHRDPPAAAARSSANGACVAL